MGVSLPQISYEGQAIVITGAGRALGRAYALEIARRGGAVVVNDVGGVSSGGPAWADQVVAEIHTAGGRAVASYDSVMTPAGGQAIIDGARSAFGRVDAVINNAGFLRPGMFEQLTPAQVTEVMDVHLLAAFHITQPAWTLMQQQGYGRVVFTSSSASFGNEAGANYAAAKAGLLGLAAALALEGRHHDIKVNCVLPFAISPINKENPILGSDSPRNRAALEAMAHRREPQSVAPLVAYLASSACTVTGQAFSALAGRVARVALVIANGWIGDPATMTAEDVETHLAEIADLKDGLAPHSMTEELEHVLARLKQRGLA